MLYHFFVDLTAIYISADGILRHLKNQQIPSCYRAFNSKMSETEAITEDMHYWALVYVCA